MRILSEEVLAGLPDPVLVSDPQGSVTYANRAATEALGLGEARSDGIRVADLIAQEPAWTERELARLAREGQWRGRVEVRTNAGPPRAFDVHAGALEAAEGTRHLWVLREIPVTAVREALALAQFGVVRILYEASSLEEAAPQVLRTLAEGLRWDLAELWVTGDGTIRRLDAWTNPNRDLAAFADLTAEAEGGGKGLAARVVSSGSPVWIRDLEGEPDLTPTAVEHGIRSALGVPLWSGGELLGVLTMYDRSVRDRDEELIRYLLPLGGQIGQYLARIRGEIELRVSRDQLEAILEGVGDGITVQAPNGELVYANESAARMIGFDDPAELVRTPVAEVVTRFEILDEDGTPMSLERLPGRRALLGERGAQELVRFRTQATGEERWSLVTASPVFDEAGRVRFAINIFQDVTARRRTEESHLLLGEASALLASSLDYRSTLESVARLVVSRLADWCVVFVREPGGLTQLEVAHADPSRLGLVRQLQEDYPFDERRPGPLREVLTTGRSVLLEDIPDEMVGGAAQDEAHYRRLLELGLRSAMVVPMRAAERVVGAIVLISAESLRRYDRDDLGTAEELARRAGMAIEHARLYRESSRVAESLRRSLLPPSLPEIPGLEVAARYHAAEDGIGGDFYDAFASGGGSWCLVIGDVTGRGASAAAMTSLARYTIRTAATGASPGQALRILNRTLTQSEQDPDFCTAAVIRLAPSRDQMSATIASGGHPLPLRVRDGRVDEVGGPGTLIGMIDRGSFPEDSVSLAPGDVLFLYTDGLVERRPDGMERLKQVLAWCSGMEPERIADRIDRELVLSDVLRDDVAFFVARVVATTGS